MGLRNTTTEWGSLTKALHWIIAIGIDVVRRMTHGVK
jgi:cytochrome b561